MKSLWDSKEAKKCKGDLLKLRVYTSRLLGANEDLVMHGGGNTSVKVTEKNLFGEPEDLLYVKGSGWDLATIEAEGFAPVQMDTLLKMAKLRSLSDVDMVNNQRAAMTNPSAPNPSVEAILHAIIPFAFVDHTHADAVVTITNTPNGKKRIQEIYGNRVLIIPYVMPGFVLARKIYEMTRSLDWSTIDGMILMNHGVFTFHDDAKASYENMIKLVSKAENYLNKHASSKLNRVRLNLDIEKIARLRRATSSFAGRPMLAGLDSSQDAIAFATSKDVRKLSNRGPITPDHIIRTKRNPVVVGESPNADVDKFAESYLQYFKQHQKGEVMLDRAPRWALIPEMGSVGIGPTRKHIEIIHDIGRHTMRAILQAESLGGWKPLKKAHLFEMEYWSLEQAKLAKAAAPKEMQGKIAMVTGAASGIGAACVEALVNNGAVVAALDIAADVHERFDRKEVITITCDVTREKSVKAALEKIVKTFGGLDMLVSNAGIFPSSASIEEMDPQVWDKSINLNLTSHQRLLQQCIPLLELGIDSAVVFIGSKNVPAPGPGASAYSVAKAGLTQLARVAAMELGDKGIRVNSIHPNAVYDTAIWTDDVLKARARHYGLSVKAYKTNNVLKTEVQSRDVANLAVTMLGKAFAKTTGAQVPIDGGNDRVI